MVLLLSPPGVYRPQDDTAVLTGVMRRGEYARDRHVLDLGTGSGVLALAAAEAGAASVTAVDLSRRAVAAAWINSRLHRAPLSVRRGDLFAPCAGRRFDLILSNPPYVPAETATLPRHRIARCWDGGLDGRTVLDRICAGAAEHLMPDGVLLMVHSVLCRVEDTVARLADAGMTAEIVGHTRIPFGPVLRARAGMLAARGLIEAGTTAEDLVVVQARRSSARVRPDPTRRPATERLSVMPRRSAPNHATTSPRRR